MAASVASAATTTARAQLGSVAHRDVLFVLRMGVRRKNVPEAADVRVTTPSASETVARTRAGEGFPVRGLVGALEDRRSVPTLSTAAAKAVARAISAARARMAVWLASDGGGGGGRPLRSVGRPGPRAQSGEGECQRR